MDEVIETTGLQFQEPKEAARDRVGWRDVVRVVTRGLLRPDGTRCQVGEPFTYTVKYI